MDFKILDDLYECARRVATSGVEIKPGIEQICGRFREIQDLPIVAEWEQLDYEGEYRKLESWLPGILETHPPPADITALDFGVAYFESPDIMMSGWKNYQPGDESFDTMGYDYELNEEELPGSQILPVLQEAVEEARKPDLEIGDFSSVLQMAYIGLVTAKLCRELNVSLLAGGSQIRFIRAGFADALMLLGAVTQDGWKPRAYETGEREFAAYGGT